MEDINVKSETIDKALDLIAESSQDTRKTLDKSMSGGLNKLFQLLNATPLGIKLDTYIAERPYKLKMAMKKMQAKYEQIPTQCQAEPSSYIALKGVNELNYSLDEDHLREMFENLLISDMDNRKKSKVLPAYIDIIKQLSKKDAEFLKVLNKFITRNDSLALDIIQYKEANSIGAIDIDRIIIPDSSHTIRLDNVIIDNLERTKLIELYDDRTITNCPFYKNGFDLVKHDYPSLPKFELSYKSGILKVTNFGKNFIDICLS